MHICNRYEPRTDMEAHRHVLRTLVNKLPEIEDNPDLSRDVKAVGVSRVSLREDLDAFRDLQANVLGGEVALWSETVDPVNMDGLLWPRSSAAGEVLWSGRQDASGQNRSQLDAAPRLAMLRERMVARGVAASPVQMIFCTQNNATDCSYPVP